MAINDENKRIDFDVKKIYLHVYIFVYASFH